MSESLGIDQNKYIDITKLSGGISCGYICIFFNYEGYVVLKCNKEE